jgi:hypothetical protein
MKQKTNQAIIMYKLFPGLIISCVAILSSCATYNLSNQSLLEQFAGSGTEKKTIFLIVPPYIFFPGVVNGNDLKSIKCSDKNGREQVIEITNRTGIRITTKDGKKTTFYFNTLIIRDSTITGSKTHFFNAQIKPIELNKISKIEIQK